MQRVAIGRALVRDPSIYLMDEPLSSLDAKLRAELRLELKRIQVELASTILYVTHDHVEAMTMASRIGIVKAAVLQVGTPGRSMKAPLTAMWRAGSARRRSTSCRRIFCRTPRCRPAPRSSASAPNT